MIFLYLVIVWLIFWGGLYVVGRRGGKRVIDLDVDYGFKYWLVNGVGKVMMI